MTGNPRSFEIDRCIYTVTALKSEGMYQVVFGRTCTDDVYVDRLTLGSGKARRQMARRLTYWTSQHGGRCAVEELADDLDKIAAAVLAESVSSESGGAQ